MTQQEDDKFGSIGHQVKNVYLCYIMGAGKSTLISGKILTVGAQGLRPFFDKISLSP
jgi:hypothetical protein